MAFLEAKAVSYAAEDGIVLNGITFRQEQRQKIAIAGETGSGKSTLLKIIAGLIQPDSGEVWFEGERVKGPLEKLVPGHPKIAYLSQHFELPKFLRVEQVLSYANLLSDHQAIGLYEICQIDHLLKRKTDQLSGGERQRIALARILIASPSLVLLDEPFSNLDMVHKNTLKEIIDDISSELNISSILISHDPDDTLPWAHKIIVMRRGTIVQKDIPTLIYNQPSDEYTAGIFGKYNVIDKSLAAQLQISMNGSDNVFLRPEHFSINPDTDALIECIIEKISYYGGHYEIEADFQGRKLRVTTPMNSFKKGETIWLSILDRTH